MKAPVKKPYIDIGIGWSEFVMFLAGLTVFIGLWMESGREWRNAWITKKWPAKEIIGSGLVALGVFAEACLGISSARSSRKKEVESNNRIAELNTENVKYIITQISEARSSHRRATDTILLPPK